METVTSVYKKNYHIDLRDVDFTKKLKLSTLFGYFQDSASLAAENLGAGIEILENKFGVAWVLTRIRVDIMRNPEWDEEIIIETWPLEPSKVEFDRDFLVKDQYGNTIIKAVSKWVIMDMIERKLRRSELIGLQFPEAHRERALNCKLEKLKDFGRLETAYHKVIRYSDIDFNGHLNNSKYVDYIMDCFPVEDYRSYAIQTIDLHFNHEAMPGDTLTLNKDISMIDKNVIYIEGVNNKENKGVFKSQIVIAANN